MAATNFTPISLYFSATAAAVPLTANLVAGELALNTIDGKLFYKDSSNVVQVLGTKGGVGSSTTTQVLYNNAGLTVGSANMTFNGTILTSSFSGPMNGTIGATTPAAGTFTAISGPLTGTVGATTPAAGAFTTLNGSSALGILSAVGYGASAGTTFDMGINTPLAVNGSQAYAWRWSVDGNAAGQSLTLSALRRDLGAVLAVVVDNNGNLLVGTNAASNIGSGGHIYITGGTSKQYIGHISGTANGEVYVSYYYNGGAIGSITQSGTTGVLYNTTSDHRLKSNQQPLVGSGVFIDALKPTAWEWTRDGRKDAGFLAHEFQAVCPNSVTGVKDEMVTEQYEVTPANDSDRAVMGERTVPRYQSMQASSPEMMANIVAELQSLRARITALESA